MGAPKQVLFVCTGNTCRSPLAEGMFRKLTEGRGDYAVASAGVAAMRGGPASAETLAVLRARGIELDGFRSQAVSAELVAEASHVFAMTVGHLASLERRFPEHADKFYLVCEFAEIPGQGIGVDVPDPIGLGRSAYEEVAAVLDLALPAIIAYIDQTSKA
jgi:protein-tyrosine-phosphatase